MAFPKNGAHYSQINGFVPGDGTAVIDRHGGTYFGEIWKVTIILLITHRGPLVSGPVFLAGNILGISVLDLGKSLK